MAVKLKLDDFFFKWVSGVVGPNVVSLPDNADTSLPKPESWKAKASRLVIVAHHRIDYTENFSRSDSLSPIFKKYYLLTFTFSSSPATTCHFK